MFMLAPHAQMARRMVADSGGQFLCLDEDATAGELAANFAAAEALGPLVRNLQAELDHTRNLNAKAARTIEELDEEMRLAARLQRDFLPRRLPEVGAARFGMLYRPASWVSGDIYDIVRLDETHVGFYVADVVGHGMPAALLTMFIKKALQTKRIVGNSYQIVPPDVSLKELNTDICEQNLSSCQFCTAIYAVMDTQSLQLSFARGGHPEPVIIRPDGEIRRLWVEGSLLGVFPDEDFAAQQVQLWPGDRLLLYTDGAEPILCRDRDDQPVAIEESLKRFSGMGRDEMLLSMSAELDDLYGDASPEDDITIMVMDIE
jgi:sigma-B regulation protein RsbU (phosphoserine phosphatase)